MSEQEMREKVIKGLMVCFTRIRCKGNGCPYESEYERSRLCQAHLRDDAIALLKAQELVEPIENAGFYYCGACRYAFTSARQKYCSECGKPVKWE